MTSSRRVLILAHNVGRAPFRQRIEPYLAPLARRDIHCHVADLSGKSSRGKLLRSASDFDGVWLQRKTLTLWAARTLRRNAGRVLYDLDDTMMFRPRVEDAKPDRRRSRRFRHTVRIADLVIAGNPNLAQQALENGAARVEVIPTGLDTSRYVPKQHRGNGRALRLVWIGSRSTLKQLRMFRSMLETVGRSVPEVVLRVIADDQLEVESLKVENLAWTRHGEARMLAECDIGIAPLPDTPFARGKCAFKVLQYMATGLPVVTSPVGANAEYVVDGQTGLWASSDGEWLAALQSLAADPALRARMGAAGRELACTKFDFSVLATKVCDAVAAALA